MNDFKSIIKLALDCRGIFEIAAVLAFFCSFLAALIGADIYAVYSQLLPWENLWSRLTSLDQWRAVFMIHMVGLAVWYASGAFNSYSRHYVERG